MGSKLKETQLHKCKLTLAAICMNHFVNLVLPCLLTSKMKFIYANN